MHLRMCFVFFLQKPSKLTRFLIFNLAPRPINAIFHFDLRQKKIKKKIQEKNPAYLNEATPHVTDMSNPI